MFRPLSLTLSEKKEIMSCVWFVDDDGNGYSVRWEEEEGLMSVGQITPQQMTQPATDNHKPP